jgi:uncharacterized protein YjaZ
MDVFDITQSYIENYLNKDNLLKYEESFPELFSHYFEYWGDRESFVGALKEKETNERLDLLKRNLSYIGEQFKKNDIDISHLPVTLFVGQNYTNGHVFRHGDVFKTFLPIEGYKTDVQVKVFVPHEILHAIHYQIQPVFYFENKTEKELFSRMLITEGLATLLTREIMGLSDKQALWADYLNESELDSWMEKCKDNFTDLCRFAVEHFYSSEHSEMFYNGGKKGTFKNREGYYLGMIVLEKVVRKQNMEYKKLLTLPRHSLEAMVLEELKNSNFDILAS